MPARATSRRLTVGAAVAGLWLCVTVGRCGASGAQLCDDGKFSAEVDLSTDVAHWDCAALPWPASSQTLQAVDTTHNPEPAGPTCMDRTISYNRSVPNSGDYRPVRAESGEYLYCPPQRWLNNLHHGAAVLLYHPCAPLHQRHLLSDLARSCLRDFILTPHPLLSRLRPIALMSWGRTLELHSVNASEICPWLELLQSKSQNSDVAPRPKYNLLLSWSAEQQRESHPRKQEESPRQCCERIITSALSRTAEPGKRQQSQKRRKTREVRSATSRKQHCVQGQGATNNNNLMDLKIRSISRRTGQGQNHSSLHQAQTSSGTNTSDASPPEEHKLVHPKGSEGNDKHNQEAPPPVPEEKPADLLRHRDHDSRQQNSYLNDADEKTERKSLLTHGELKDNIKVIEVTERDLEHRHQRGNTVPDPHPELKPQQSSPSADQSRPVSTDCTDCTAAEDCDCSRSAAAAVLMNGLPRTPRSDEAVWAAAALGFLLILLTLSVLHTRLYRQWRTMPSLYWHDPQHDYDSVADVIRRRLRITKRRRKRSRKLECVLIPSSSSSEELP